MIYEGKMNYNELISLFWGEKDILRGPYKQKDYGDIILPFVLLRRIGRVQSHCSGHSKGQDLLDIVKSIDSKMLFPIHTEHPDAYKKVTDKITIVQEAKRYEI